MSIPQNLLNEAQMNEKPLLQWLSQQKRTALESRCARHALVKLRQKLDLTPAVQKLADYHHQSGPGRPAEHTVERLLRAVVVGAMYDLSLRELEMQLYADGLTQYFCDYWDWEVKPDHSTLGRFEVWLFLQHPTLLFDEVVQQIDRQFVGESKEVQIGDTYALLANAAREHLVDRVRHACRRLVKEYKASRLSEAALGGFEWERLNGKEKERPAAFQSEAERQAILTQTALAGLELCQRVKRELEKQPRQEYVTVRVWCGAVEKILKDEVRLQEKVPVKAAEGSPEPTAAAESPAKLSEPTAAAAESPAAPPEPAAVATETPVKPAEPTAAVETAANPPEPSAAVELPKLSPSARELLKKWNDGKVKLRLALPEELFAELWDKLTGLQAALKPKKERGSYRIGSATDLEASYRQHGKADEDVSLGYNVQVCATPSGLIRMVKAYCGATPDPHGVADLIAQQMQRHGVCPQKLIYDCAAGTGKVRAEVEQVSGGRTQVCAKLPPYDQRHPDRFGPYDFSLSEDGKTLTCPNGKSTSVSYSVLNTDGRNFRFLGCQCWRGKPPQRWKGADLSQRCPLWAKCRTEKVGPNAHRQVFISDYRQQVLAAQIYNQSEEFAQDRKTRPMIERVIFEITHYNGGRRCRRRGLALADAQANHNAAACNLKWWARRIKD